MVSLFVAALKKDFILDLCGSASMGSGRAGSFSSNPEDFDCGSELEVAAKKEVMVWLEELQLETNLPAERLMLRRAGLQASRSPAAAVLSRPRMDITPENTLEAEYICGEEKRYLL